MLRQILRPAVLAAIGLAPMLPLPAFAHAFLTTAMPAVGSTVAAPSSVVCNYTEALEPLFSHLEVENAAGVEVDRKDMHLASGNAEQMIVDLPKLPPGVYHVIWHATSVDTHKTQGDFHFTIAP